MCDYTIFVSLFLFLTNEGVLFSFLLSSQENLILNFDKLLSYIFRPQQEREKCSHRIGSIVFIINSNCYINRTSNCPFQSSEVSSQTKKTYMQHE